MTFDRLSVSAWSKQSNYLRLRDRIWPLTDFLLDWSQTETQIHYDALQQYLITAAYTMEEWRPFRTWREIRTTRRQGKLFTFACCTFVPFSRSTQRDRCFMLVERQSICSHRLTEFRGTGRTCSSYECVRTSQIELIQIPRNPGVLKKLFKWTWLCTYAAA